MSISDILLIETFLIKNTIILHKDGQLGYNATSITFANLLVSFNPLNLKLKNKKSK